MTPSPPSPETLPVAELALRLGLSLAFGLALGLERELRGKSAGLRTHALVALSSAALTVFSLELAAGLETGRDPLRVVQGVAQAIGLICAGMVIHGQGGGVRNLTTAATLWTAAAVGIACGAGFWALAALTAAGVLLVVVLGGIAVRILPRSGED